MSSSMQNIREIGVTHFPIMMDTEPTNSKMVNTQAVYEGKPMEFKYPSKFETVSMLSRVIP